MTDVQEAVRLGRKLCVRGRRIDQLRSAYAQAPNDYTCRHRLPILGPKAAQLTVSRKANG